MPPGKLRLSLTLLGCLLPGLAHADQAADQPATIPELEEGLEEGTALAEDATWKALLPLWQEAAAIGDGERGAYPFDRAGKEKLVAALEASKATLDELQAKGLLTAPEAGLLKADVDTLLSGVSSKRPTEMEMATCYRPMMATPAKDAAVRLEARLPLLEQLAAEGVLHPDVVERVLVQVESDIAQAGKPGGYPMSPDERDAVRATAETAQASVTTIRARLEEAE